MRLSFKKESPAGSVLTNWWEELQHDSGGRARLSRCKTPEEVMLEPAFHRLLNRMRSQIEQASGFSSGESYLRLAAVAGLLSHVRVRDNAPLAERMAAPKGARPVFSSLRFRRLLKETFDDLYPAMVRVIRQLNKTASLSDLAESVYGWGDQVRKRWALSYFSKVVD